MCWTSTAGTMCVIVILRCALYLSLVGLHPGCGRSRKATGARRRPRKGVSCCIHCSLVSIHGACLRHIAQSMSSYPLAIDMQNTVNFNANLRCVGEIKTSPFIGMTSLKLVDQCRRVFVCLQLPGGDGHERDVEL